MSAESDEGMWKAIRSVVRLQRESPPIQPVRRDGALPLSFAQQRLWFGNQFLADSAFTHIPATMGISGELDPDLVRRGVNDIVRRHEVLRTTFRATNGVPMQAVAPTLNIAVPLVDLQGLSSREQEVQALKVARQVDEQPYDLEVGPLIRVVIVRLENDLHTLILNLHHIVTDGWSMSVIIRELFALCSDYSRGKPSTLPELSIQYPDFAVWQRDWLQGDVLEELVSYWREQLADAPKFLELSHRRHKRRRIALDGDRVFVSVPIHLVEALRSIAVAEHGTLFMVLLAAFQTLLHRYTGEHDIVVGTPMANRNRIEVQRLVGVFINTIVLRTDLSGDPSFRELFAAGTRGCVGGFRPPRHAV